jgi:hypothetical protein
MKKSKRDKDLDNLIIMWGKVPIIVKKSKNGKIKVIATEWKEVSGYIDAMLASITDEDLARISHGLKKPDL